MIIKSALKEIHVKGGTDVINNGLAVLGNYEMQPSAGNALSCFSKRSTLLGGDA